MFIRILIEEIGSPSHSLDSAKGEKLIINRGRAGEKVKSEEVIDGTVIFFTRYCKNGLNPLLGQS